MSDTRGTACQNTQRIRRIDHFTIRCDAARLEALAAFYQSVLGLRPGPRPGFDFPGLWMYAGDRALVHLAATLAAPAPSAPPADGHAQLDHVSLLVDDLEATRRRLGTLAVAYEELPVPGWPLHQIFLHDPVGTRIELTFEVGA